MTLKAVIYARYSSDLQRDASIEDQIRLCSEKAEQQGWQIVNCYSDAGISGASLMRPGIQSLMQDALAGQFDIVLCEAMDRLSRDQEDIAGIYKRMEFAGIKIITLSEGEINTMHIGLKGTMNAMFLKDLADKTRRGLRGKIEKALSGGGLSYGYNVVKKFDARGEALKGEREINSEHATIITRIFKAYAHDNQSPKAIAAQLNQEGIAAPSGGPWGQSTINGNRKRGTGILNNELYIGQLVWNRQRFLKDPRTGKRVARYNDESEWIRMDVPELRIVSDELWQAVKQRQSKIGGPQLHKANRPHYLLSGLLVCGQCGGGFSKINTQRYGCSNAKNKGDAVCDNRNTILKETLEATVLDALEQRLMRDDMVEIFCEEYRQHMNKLSAAQEEEHKALQVQKTKYLREKDNIVQAVKDGLPAAMLKDDLVRVSNELERLDKQLQDSKTKQKPFLHPAMSSHYRDAIRRLRNALSSGDAHEAKDHVRALIDKIILSPKRRGKGLRIDLRGNLAEILAIAMEKDDMKKEIEKVFDDPRLDCSLFKQKSQTHQKFGSGGWI